MSARRSSLKRLLIPPSLLIVPLAVAYAPAHAAPIFFGPTHYLSAADVPSGLFLNDTPDFLEDFEDGSLDFGLTATPGFSVVGPGGLTDSVDADDGVIDGSGQNGHSFGASTGGSTGITMTFAVPVEAAGMVWTDGAGLVTFEAFAPGMVSLGTVVADIADGSFSGTTADDHFFGVVDVINKVSAIKLSTDGGGGIEIDHVQAALTAVPEPSTALLVVLGLCVLAARGRRSPRRGRRMVCMRVGSP